LLPTLRDSLPEPFTRDLWPAHTAVTVRDVLIGAVSMQRLVDLCATPCVMTSDAVTSPSGGMASPLSTTSVVIASVVEAGDEPGLRTVRLDARLSAVEHHGSQLRMLGRISHAPFTSWVVLDADGSRVALDAPSLPRDLRAGDLLAIPCRGAVALSDIRPLQERR